MSSRIYGQIPDFEKKLSTVRSRGISVIIVCQHVAGIKSLYPNDIWQGLVGNCDIKIIMGTNDLLTAQYISDSLGVASVESKSIRKNAAFDGSLEYGKESTSVVKRNLMNPDEIIRMKNDEQIIIIRGQKPFKCKKLKYWEYRLGINLEKTPVTNYIPETKKMKNVKNNTQEIDSKKEFFVSNQNEEERLPTFVEYLNRRRHN